MEYESPFTKEMNISDSEQAYNTYIHFCDYCIKDSVSRFYCPYVDSKQYEEVEQQILPDWRT